MVCAFCGNMKTSVRNSRHTSRRGQVWRRRQCEECLRIFTTRESIELGFLEVLKRSNQRESYSRAKLLRSLLKATDHLKDADSAFSTVDTIETMLLKRVPEKSNQISTSAIAETTLQVLKRFDTRAYVKYLSYQTDILDARDLKAKLTS